MQKKIRFSFHFRTKSKFDEVKMLCLLTGKPALLTCRLPLPTQKLIEPEEKPADHVKKGPNRLAVRIFLSIFATSFVSLDGQAGGLII